MGVFYILLLIPILIQHISKDGCYVDYRKKNQNALALFFVLLTIVIMFRHESVGSDTRNYILFFKNFSQISWGEVAMDTLEPGFSYFNKFVSLISKKPQFFLSITAVLTSVMIYPTYRRLCVDASFTIVLFCTMSTFVMMFSGIRQMLAIGIGFICYEFTRKKRFVKFVFVVLIAMTFHTSAFMLIFMYPIYHTKLKKKWLIMVIPILITLYIFNQSIFSILSNIIEQYTKYEGGISSTGAYTMLILFAIFTLFTFIVPEEENLDDETIGLRNFLLFSLVLQMFAPLHTLAMRMNYYYIIFIPLLLPKIVLLRSNKWDQIAILGRHIMVIFFFGYFFINAYKGGSLHVFPYHFFWEGI